MNAFRLQAIPQQVTNVRIVVDDQHRAANGGQLAGGRWFARMQGKGEGKLRSLIHLATNRDAAAV